jgi:hypothetical protein
MPSMGGVHCQYIRSDSGWMDLRFSGLVGGGTTPMGAFTGCPRHLLHGFRITELESENFALRTRTEELK